MNIMAFSTSDVLEMIDDWRSDEETTNNENDIGTYT